MHSLSDLDVLELYTLCKEYKRRAISMKCSVASKDRRAFCVAQLTTGGARVLHRFVNRQNAAPPVAMFKRNASGQRAHTPNEAVQQDALHWSKFWTLPTHKCVARDVLRNTRNRCRSGLLVDLTSDMYDIPEFDARTYKKVSKGSDHWLVCEPDLPEVLAAPIAKAVDNAMLSHAWAHQSLLNLHPELGK